MRTIQWILLCLFLIAPALHADEACKYRGDLNAAYCDENKDFVADAPKTPARYKNPDTLTFMYATVKDASVIEKTYKPFTEHLAQCVGKPVTYMNLPSSDAQLEAMRSGRLHVAAFGTGLMPAAVNTAGAVPFATPGKGEKQMGNHLILIVREDRPYKNPTDLKNKKVAHVSATSNSGHIAPLALFPKVGLTPGKDYQILFSGSHDQSIMGVRTGQYDAAAVASDVLGRMITLGQIAEDEFRVLYKSPWFPPASMAHAHDLDPKLRDRVVKCFYDYRFPPEMQKTFDGADRFVSVNYLQDWYAVRSVATFTEGLKKNK